MKYLSKQNNNKSAKRGEQLVRIGIPTAWLNNLSDNANIYSHIFWHGHKVYISFQSSQQGKESIPFETFFQLNQSVCLT